MSRLKPQPTSPLRDTAIAADRIVDRSVTGVKRGTGVPGKSTAGGARSTGRNRSNGLSTDAGKRGRIITGSRAERACKGAPPSVMEQCTLHQPMPRAAGLPPRPLAFFGRGISSEQLRDLGKAAGSRCRKNCAKKEGDYSRARKSAAGSWASRVNKKEGGRCGPPLPSWSPEPGSSRGPIRPPREANFDCLHDNGASRVPGRCENRERIHRHD